MDVFDKDDQVCDCKQEHCGEHHIVPRMQGYRTLIGPCGWIILIQAISLACLLARVSANQVRHSLLKMRRIVSHVGCV